MNTATDRLNTAVAEYLAALTQAEQSGNSTQLVRAMESLTRATKATYKLPEFDSLVSPVRAAEPRRIALLGKNFNMPGATKEAA